MWPDLWAFTWWGWLLTVGGTFAVIRLCVMWLDSSCGDDSPEPDENEQEIARLRQEK